MMQVLLVGRFVSWTVGWCAEVEGGVYGCGEGFVGTLGIQEVWV
jgi:hypothetical protein